MEPDLEHVAHVMRETGMGYVQARNHLKSQMLLRDLSSVTSGLQQHAIYAAKKKAAVLAQQVIAKAAQR